jgi:hypothetical protein
MGIYRNVMELLVEEEVVRQFQALPERVAAYVNQAEWVAYALNQLSPLYATSEKGLHHQLQKGRAKHGAEIRQAVQRALAAVRRDPLRTSQPLQLAQMPQAKVLAELRVLLKNDQLEWDMLPAAVEQVLERVNRNQLMSNASVRSTTYRLLRSSSPFPNYEPSQPTSIEPPKPKQFSQRSPIPDSLSQEEEFGWDDPLYNSH